MHIGNYHDSANGSLQLSLYVDGTCQDATAPLAGSKDNSYLVFTLANPATLAAASTLEYTFTRSADASNRVAIWGYPAQRGLVDAAGKHHTQLVPRLALYVAQ